jgi:uncharacterized protein YjdB
MAMLLKPAKFLAKTSILSVFLWALSVTASAETLVQVAANPVNFGQVKQGKTVTAKFELTNTGSKPLTIQFMEFSMPGMRANVQATIAAGASTEVLMTWDTSQLSGEVKGETILTFNDPQKQEVTLTLSGTVVP